MKNPNKYQRNKEKKAAAKRRAFDINGGQFKHKSFMPFSWFGGDEYSHEKQLKSHQDYCGEIADHFLNGGNSGSLNAPKWFKKEKERSWRHKQNQKLREHEEDFEGEEGPKDANWDWF